MDPFEMVIALAGIILSGFIFAKIIGLIKSWINRSNNDIPEEAFDRLAKAFIQYKKDSERRIENLEAIIPDDGEIRSNAGSNEKKLQDSPKGIEMEARNAQDESSEVSDRNNLRNMLRE